MVMFFMATKPTCFSIVCQKVIPPFCWTDLTGCCMHERESCFAVIGQLSCSRSSSSEESQLPSSLRCLAVCVCVCVGVCVCVCVSVWLYTCGQTRVFLCAASGL